MSEVNRIPAPEEDNSDSEIDAEINRIIAEAKKKQYAFFYEHGEKENYGVFLKDEILKRVDAGNFDGLSPYSWVSDPEKKSSLCGDLEYWLTGANPRRVHPSKDEKIDYLTALHRKLADPALVAAREENWNTSIKLNPGNYAFVYLNRKACSKLKDLVEKRLEEVRTK